MQPRKLLGIMKKGPVKKYLMGEIFHSLDFSENELYVVKSGFVKRYSVNERKVKAIESIYGPNYFFPLSPVFKQLFNYELNQQNNTYMYQAMTGIELQGIKVEELIELLEDSPELYADLLYETGRRLKVDIDRLTSNTLPDNAQKVVHQLVCLIEEFCNVKQQDLKISVKLPMPLENTDLAEQINITTEEVDKVINRLQEEGLLSIKDRIWSVPDFLLLKNSYL